MKNLYLICNAHLDPVWMWEKDEGIAEVLSTYRVAADFCEEYSDFVFNHNEAVLYEWVEELDPQLFARIQKLVKMGRWTIMGGFYLQPDCNLPSGEAMIRQALVGRKYFWEKFGAFPTTAMNFDSFGHSRGLVQILKKAGYDAYVVCRPVNKNCPLPAENFTWVGYDGSEVSGHRAYNSYESHRGEVDAKIRGYLEKFPEADPGIVLWGIGNHGGGPSRIDYQLICDLADSIKGEYRIKHSTLDAYFREVREKGVPLPKVEKPLQYHSVGCYTSQIRVKQRYRLLENMLFKVEKMASSAALNGLLPYPKGELEEAQKDMLFNQFHDILPGTSIESAEKAALRQLDHGIELTERIKIRTFLSLMRGEKKAEDGSIPIFVYNPHPVKLPAVVECEFNLPDQNKDSSKWAFPRVYRDGQPIPCQVEHEESNFNVDWRKRVVFAANLEPSCLNRFECRVEFWPKEPECSFSAENGKIHFDTDDISVEINCATGTMDRYAIKGKDYLKPGAFQPLVMKDDYDSWGNTTKEFREIYGRFVLMTPEEGTAYSGIEASHRIESVRVIENGAIRTVVEALFRCKDSFLTLRYYLPKKGSEVKITVRVLWNEKMKLLKLSVPTFLENADYIGQTMFGREKLPNDGMEAVSQRWCAAVSECTDSAVTIVNNGTYGSDCKDGEIRLSLLRSPGYSAGCSDFSRRKPEVMEQGRCNIFMDQGVREFTFWLNAGTVQQRLENVELEAAAANETPFALSCFPDGDETISIKALVQLDNPVIQLTAFKKSEYSDRYIFRLFEPTGMARSCTVTIPVKDNASQTFELGGFEILTVEFDGETGVFRKIPLLERDFKNFS